MVPKTATIVIVGGVAGGASAATRARRMNEHAEIILLEKDEHVSFANCGLPYYIGGEIADRQKLLVATPEFLARRFRIDVRTCQNVESIDRVGKAITIRNLVSGETYSLAYDKLILAPGAAPLMPPLPGRDAANVFTLRNMADTDRIKAAADACVSKRAVVVGSGYIGLEMVEQLVRQGFQVALAELLPQILPLLDVEMAQPLEETLRRHGVEVYLRQALERFQLFLLLDQDRLLDFLRTAPGPNSADRDHGPLDIGRQLDRDGVQGDHAEQNDENHADGDFHRVLDRETDRIHVYPS